MVSCFMWSGALDSFSALLLYSYRITIIAHNPYTNVHPLINIHIILMLFILILLYYYTIIQLDHRLSLIYVGKPHKSSEVHEEVLKGMGVIKSSDNDGNSGSGGIDNSKSNSNSKGKDEGKGKGASSSSAFHATPNPNFNSNSNPNSNPSQHPCLGRLRDLARRAKDALYSGVSICMSQG